MDIFRPSGEAAMQRSKIATRFLENDVIARRQLFGENLAASVRPSAAMTSRTFSGAEYSSCIRQPIYPRSKALPSVVDLKFLPLLRQALIGTSNPKPH